MKTNIPKVLGLTVFLLSSTAYAGQLFPPVNEIDCTEHTVLAWDKASSQVYCKNAVPSGTLCGAATYSCLKGWIPTAPCQGINLPNCPSGYTMRSTGDGLVVCYGNGAFYCAATASCVKN